MADETQYIETFSDVMQWKIDEWIGRCYAQSVGEVYPIPDTSPHYKENGYYYKYAEQKQNMPGGVLTVDETIISFSDKIQQLSDMSYFCPDVHTNLKTYDQLSDDGKAIIPGPPLAEDAEAAEQPISPEAPAQTPGYGEPNAPTIIVDPELSQPIAPEPTPTPSAQSEGESPSW